MGMMQDKRGLLFTLTAIALLSLSVLLLTTQGAYQLQADQFVITQRLQSMNKFIDNVQTDSSFALYASGFRATLATVEEVTSTGVYDTDPEETIAELVLNGTLDGVPAVLLVNNTLVNWTTKMQQQADSIGIDLYIEVDEVVVNQTSPWAITVAARFNLDLYDQRQLAWWELSFTQNAEIEIEGFEDPLYIVETGNQYNQLINQSPVDGEFVIGADTSNLRDHIENGWYIAHNSSPSYLGRIAGNLSASLYGIESLVDKDALSLVVPIDVDQTNVDYLYFGGFGGSVYDFFNVPANFRLDNQTNGNMGRIERYNLTDLD